MHRFRLCSGAALLTVLAAALSPAARAQSADYFGCDFDSSGKFAAVDRQKFGKCYSRRPQDEGSPFILKDPAVIVTRCPVKITEIYVHSTRCQAADKALQKDDQVRIDRWGDDDLRLSINRKGKQLFEPLKLEKLIVTDDAGNKQLLGYYVEHDFWNTFPFYYHVYLVYRDIYDQGNVARAAKFYEVEVFRKREACLSERPKQETFEIKECSRRLVPRTAATADNLKDPLGPVQLPSGGGGEPPPKN